MAEGTNKPKTRIHGLDSGLVERELTLTSDGKMPVVIAPPTDSITIDFAYANASLAPVIANSFITVLEYTVPSGYNLNIINFKSSSSNTAGFARISQRTSFGSYNAGTNVFSDGDSIAEPKFASTMEMQVTTAFSGNTTFTITYTNQSGVTGRTGTVAINSVAKRALGARILITLQAGDFGIREVTNVADDGAATGIISVNGYNEFGYQRHVISSLVYDTQYASSQLLIPEGEVILFEAGATNTVAVSKTIKAIAALIVKV